MKNGFDLWTMFAVMLEHGRFRHMNNIFLSTTEQVGSCCVARKLPIVVSEVRKASIPSIEHLLVPCKCLLIKMFLPFCIPCSLVVYCGINVFHFCTISWNLFPGRWSRQQCRKKAAGFLPRDPVGCVVLCVWISWYVLTVLECRLEV